MVGQAYAETNFLAINEMRKSKKTSILEKKHRERPEIQHEELFQKIERNRSEECLNQNLEFPKKKKFIIGPTA